ncbi:hypothetical protein EUGRSUZ_D00107 [Eucalyptus grandis]|uniref:Uncharacterized protein n=2 Tax=Eucalyptus grandis TaxID=71139 RepID=A0ACC3L2N3_EUCGR|nr:hypothetical protein EUGRSUZ_D00107 [Eucalyptus grandis]
MNISKHKPNYLFTKTDTFSSKTYNIIEVSLFIYKLMYVVMRSKQMYKLIMLQEGVKRAEQKYINPLLILF